jgi:hypothetical protein
VPEKETVLESTDNLALDGDKVRLECNHPIFSAPYGDLVTPRREGYFNGETAKLFFPAGMAADGSPSGIIEGTRQFWRRRFRDGAAFCGRRCWSTLVGASHGFEVDCAANIVIG